MPPSDGASDGQEPTPALESVRSATGNPSDGGHSPAPRQGQDGASGTQQTGTQQSQPEPTPAPSQDWRNRRIDTLTAQLRETQRELAAERERSAGSRPGGDPGPAPAPGLSEAEVERRAEARAGQIAMQREFDNACNATAAEGHKAFPDFQSRIDSLRRLSDPRNPQETAAYNSMLAAAIENGPAEAAKILHHLGGDLNEAQRILSLPPMKMAVELTKLAISGAAGEPSSAPRPITPVAGGRQGPHTQIDPTDPDRADNLSTAEWMRRREEQLARRTG